MHLHSLVVTVTCSYPSAADENRILPKSHVNRRPEENTLREDRLSRHDDREQCSRNRGLSLPKDTEMPRNPSLQPQSADACDATKQCHAKNNVNAQMRQSSSAAMSRDGLRGYEAKHMHSAPKSVSTHLTPSEMNTKLTIAPHSTPSHSAP